MVVDGPLSYEPQGGIARRMYAILIFGVLIMAISVFMIAKPDQWVDLAMRYCRLPYMHPLEILICLGFGVPFILNGGRSAFPMALTVFGYVLTAVGVGLMFTPPSYHRRFGLWSLQKMRRLFRPAGVFSLLLGAFLVYAAS